MSTGRILLDQDNELKGRILGDFNKFKKTFEAVKSKFAELQMGNLTNDIYDIIANGNAKNLRKAYIQSVDDQLIASGVTNTVLKNLAMQGTHELFDGFLSAANDFVNTDLTPYPYGLDKDRAHFLALSDIDFLNGDLIVSKSSEENILERCCRIYAATDSEKAIYADAEKLRVALQSFMRTAKKIGLPFRTGTFYNGVEGYSPDSYINTFLKCDTDMNVTIIPQIIPWAAGYKAAEEARNKRGY